MTDRKIEPVDPSAAVQPVPPKTEPVQPPISKRDKSKSFQESLDKAISDKLKTKVDRKV